MGWGWEEWVGVGEIWRKENEENKVGVGGNGDGLGRVERGWGGWGWVGERREGWGRMGCCKVKRTLTRCSEW